MQLLEMRNIRGLSANGDSVKTARVFSRLSLTKLPIGSVAAEALAGLALLAVIPRVKGQPLEDRFETRSELLVFAGLGSQGFGNFSLSPLELAVASNCEHAWAAEDGAGFHGEVASGSGIEPESGASAESVSLRESAWDVPTLQPGGVQRDPLPASTRQIFLCQAVTTPGPKEMATARRV